MEDTNGFKIEVTIWCGQPDCAIWEFVGMAGRHPWYQAASYRARHKLGWKVIKDVWTCPTCQQKAAAIAISE